MTLHLAHVIDIITSGGDKVLVNRKTIQQLMSAGIITVARKTGPVLNGFWIAEPQ